MAYGTVNADVIGTSVAGSNLGAGNASIMKNRIINGAMVINQRGASVTADSQFPVDRFQSGKGGSATVTWSQASTAPAGFNNSLLFTVGSTDTTPNNYFSRQIIEGYNIADLGWGTSAAKTITVSFWVNSSVTGTFGVYVTNTSRSYATSYTVSSANTWQQVSVTIPGDTSGTWNTNNTYGIILGFGYSVATGSATTPNQWNATDTKGPTGTTNLLATNGATFYITGVQLEVGSSATGFEYRQYTTELQLCQRYCFLLTSVGGSGSYIRWATGENSGTTGNNTPIMFPTTMRTNASLTTTGTASNYTLSSNGSGIAVTAISTQSNACTNQTHAISVSVASGLVSGGCSTLVSNNNNTAYLLFTAEL